MYACDGKLNIAFKYQIGQYFSEFCMSTIIIFNNGKKFENTEN